MDERRATAYHEAGHAVVGCSLSPILRSRLVEAFITDAPPPGGSAAVHGTTGWRGCAFFPPEDLDGSEDDETKDVLWAMMVQTAAGQIAERRCGGCPDPDHLAGDEENIGRLAVTHSTLLPCAEMDTFIADARTEAERLVDRHWEVIEKVAEALLATLYQKQRTQAWGWGTAHYMTGDEVRNLIR